MKKQAIDNMNDNKKGKIIVIAGFLAVMFLSLWLNASAFDWGQTGDCSWSPDSIEGRITAIYMPRLFKKWTHKYPRGQYLISAIFYKSKIDKWEQNPITVKLANGKIGRTPFNHSRMYELATITRIISLIMSMGILVAVFLTVKKLFADNLAAIFSMLCLALSCHFMFYSKSGCVDMPAFFWFAWAGCFGIFAIKSNNVIYFILTGFCAAWSVCTKEGVATFNVGLFLGLAMLLVLENKNDGKTWKQAFMALLNWRLLAAFIVALLVFVTLEGLWAGLDEWNYRSKFWEGVVENEFKSVGLKFTSLVDKTIVSLYRGWGSPFMVFLALSLVYWMVKYRRQLCLTFIPLLSFFFLTVLTIGQNLPRFMMCGYAGIAIIMGKTLADWIRVKTVPMYIKVVVPVLIFIPSLIVCICFNIEMNSDTRVRAENWVKQNVPAGSIIGLSMGTSYAPRLTTEGYRYLEKWSSEGVKTKDGLVKYYPDYIIASNQWPCFTTDDKDYFKKMFKGETIYEEQAVYDKLYFRKDTILAKFILNYFELHSRISPRMMIYKKVKPKETK